MGGSDCLTVSVSVSPPCLLPDMMRGQGRWSSLGQDLSILPDTNNQSFSFLKSGTLLEQVSCHSVDKDEAGSVRLVGHVQAGW